MQKKSVQIKKIIKNNIRKIIEAENNKIEKENYQVEIVFFDIFDT